MQVSFGHGDADRRGRKGIDIHAAGRSAYAWVVNGLPIICGTGRRAVDSILRISVHDLRKTVTDLVAGQRRLCELTRKCDEDRKLPKLNSHDGVNAPHWQGPGARW